MARGSLAALLVLVIVAPIASQAATVVVHTSNTDVWKTVLWDSVLQQEFVAGTTTSGAHGEFTQGPGTPPVGLGSFHQKIGTIGDDGQRVESSHWNALPLAKLTQLGYSTFVTFDTASLATKMELMVDVNGDGLMIAGVDHVLTFEPKNQTGTVPLPGGSDPAPDQCSPVPGCIALGTWQDWDARAGAWFIDVYNSPFQQGYETLKHYATTHPLAKLTNDMASLRMTSGYDGALWTGFDGNFDAFTIVLNNTYDFEDTPAAPVITTPVEGAVLHSGSVNISGTLATETGAALSGATVTVSEGPTTLGTAVTSGTGAWSLTATVADGTHVVTASATVGTYTGPSSTRSFSVQFTPVISTPAEGALLTSTIVTVTGTGGPAQTINLFEGPTFLGSTFTGACTDPCAWSIGPVILSDGAHTITATATDGSGTSGPATRSFTIDIKPVFTSPPIGTINTLSPAVSGTTGVNMTVKVYEGPTLLGTTFTVPGCPFPCAWTIGAVTFTEGTHTLTATATEGTQTSNPASRTFTIDVTPPGPPDITFPTEGAVLNSNAVNVTGTSEGNATVKIYEGPALLGTVFSTPAGAWLFETTFVNGAHTIKAQAIDSVGNVGPFSADRHFTVAFVAPGAPTIITPSEGSIVHSPVTVSGTGQNGTKVTLIEGPIILGTTDVIAGQWTMSISLIDGAHKEFAVATDSFGNQSPPSADRNFIVDNTPPTVTFDRGLFVELLGFDQLNVSGFAQDAVAVDHIELSYNDLLLGGATTTYNAHCVGCPGSFVNFDDVPVLAPGLYRVVATAVDIAGNRSSFDRAIVVVLL